MPPRDGASARAAGKGRAEGEAHNSVAGAGAAVARDGSDGRDTGTGEAKPAAPGGGGMMGGLRVIEAVEEVVTDDSAEVCYGRTTLGGLPRRTAPLALSRTPQPRLWAL